MLSLISALAFAALSSAAPFEPRTPPSIQYGTCLTAACPAIKGLTLTSSVLPVAVGSTLTCVYTDLTQIGSLAKTCIFLGDGSLNGASSAAQCSGLTACATCADGYLLNAGQCVVQQVSVPDLTITITPTVTSTSTVPVTTTTPKVTSTITGTNTLYLRVTATIPNPADPVTTTVTVTKAVTSPISTVKSTVTKSVTTGKATKTQYELVFPTDCCPDAYLSLTAAASASASANVQKRQQNTVTVTALSTVTAVVTERAGTVTALAASVTVKVPIATVTATLSVTGKPITITQKSTTIQTITGGPKTVYATATKNFPNTGYFTSTITPPNVCPTAGASLGLGAGAGVGVGTDTVLQQAVKATIQSYAKLSAGVDVLILCGSKLLSFSGN